MNECDASRKDREADKQAFVSALDQSMANLAIDVRAPADEMGELNDQSMMNAHDFVSLDNDNSNIRV